MSVRDQATDAAAGWLVLALAGIGISAPPHVIVGGLCLSLSGALLAWKLSPEKDTRSLWVVLLSAAFVAIIAAELAEWLAPTTPLPMWMAAAGFGSRFAVRLGLRVFGAMESRSEQIADKVLDRVLPDEADK